ncbi:MAG: molybdopterin-dependent oxidoreductase [Anaerolineae bacterium]|nr:molybdopterin-dependent oxidoreductase [Anaerolineae bacterium]
MKPARLMLILSALVLMLAACASEATPEAGAPAADPEVLTLVDGETEKAYTREALEALPQTPATFLDVEYVGVAIGDLLADAGVDPEGMRALKAIAIDGYTVNYEPALFLREDVILAYAQADGPLTADDGNFRMVLPGEEGNMNARMVMTLEAVR